MRIFINDLSIYGTEGSEADLPDFMKRGRLRELTYEEDEISVAVVALNIEEKKVLTTIENFDFFQNHKFLDFVSGAFLTSPLDSLYKIFLTGLEGWALVGFSSNMLKINILIDVYPPEEFMIFFQEKPGPMILTNQIKKSFSL